MNQGRFRLVFNRLRSMMVAVAEFASAHGKAQGEADAAINPVAPESGNEASPCSLWFAARACAFAALCVFGLQPLLVEPAYAQANLPVTPDRNASGAHPAVGVAGNGVPVVNIVAPNAAGTSHNKYTDYNVGQKGLILNNSGQNSQTQTAGWVQGNPFMGNQSARTIVNEVTSGNRSQLLGMTEVAGRAANVIIANPAGIYCNGCGFIAAPRVTLSTGVPVLDANGALARLNVAQGGITIDGQGLDTRGASQTDLIARAMQINGQIWAQQLNATTGANQVSYADGSATPIPGARPRPVVAIDVSALGGMYGNNAVRLVGTELGVGVNLGGTLNSLTGDIQVTNNGDVTIAPKGALLAANNAQVSATSITNAGTVATDGEVALIAMGALTNTGTVTARTNLSSTGQSVSNTGTLAGGIATDGTVNAKGSVSAVASGVVQNSGAIQGGENALVQAASADLSNGWIHAGNVATLAVAGDVLHTNATLDAPALDVRVGGTLTNQHGSIASQAPLNLAVGAVDNRDGAVSSQGALNIDTASVQNAGGQLVAQQDIAVRAAAIGNQGGTIGSVTGAAAVSANVLDNSSGTISAAQASSVTASNLTMHQGQISGDSVNVAADSLDTQGGKIIAVHDVRVSATANLNNSAGTIGSQQRDASITAGGALANVGGTITSANNTTTLTQSLDNSSGIISASRTLNVTASRVTNASGQMSGDRVNVAANTLDTHAGQIIAVHDVTVSASGDLNNSSGTIGSQQGNANVAAGGALSNANGTIAGAANTGITAAALDNTSGIISAAQDASVHAASVNSENGQIGGDTVNVVANALDTRGGKIIATHDVNVQSSGDIDNSSGTIGSQQSGATIIAGGALTNVDGLITSSDTTTIRAQSFDNTRRDRRIESDERRYRQAHECRRSNHGRYGERRGYVTRHTRREDCRRS
ncbi:filamentous hemagglutinin outer membrane protein [Caballeronia sordidicola]|uniref:Filamentous hemagglutinin outer membrane protein n=1 Tax=Caballeronia sordidicola TaxID=196367 RepID=A0A158HAV5_CABSO|nr:filamentous hemagglutinin N-terminal domain-containing protein [Caballeronia sordidicola]SAL41277.1 filamentous hemagglutinin outer membrane protein [Caballeronia sordidicola]